MGHTMGDTAYCALKGLEPFDGEKTEFSTWARVLDFQFQFVVPASLGISSFEEIKEKNIKLNLGTNTYGSSAEMCTRLVLEAYGITYDWIEENGGSTTFTGFSDGVIHILDRESVRKYKIHIKRTENGNGREQRIKIVRHTKKILTLHL